MFPLSLKGSTLELGKQSEKKQKSEKQVFEQRKLSRPRQQDKSKQRFIGSNEKNSSAQKSTDTKRNASPDFSQPSIETERPRQHMIHLNTKEMSLTDCMDLSQVSDMPLNRLHFALEEIIGIH